MHDSKSDAYALSGVDLTAGYDSVERIKPHINSTYRSGVIGGFGALALEGIVLGGLLYLNEQVIASYPGSYTEIPANMQLSPADQAYLDWYRMELALYADKAQNKRPDTGLNDLPDSTIQERARDNSLSGKERKRYQTEEKVRRLRNKQKRGTK